MKRIMTPPIATSTTVMNGSNNNYTTKTDDVNNNDMNSLQEPLLPPTSVLEVQPVSLYPDLELAESDDEGDDNNISVTNVIVDESGWDHGVVQTNWCRDWFWGVLFFAQFATVLTMAIMGIRNMIQQGSDDEHDNNGDGDSINWNVVWFQLSLLGSVIGIASILINVLLGALAPMLIQISLVGSPILSFIAFVVSLVTLNVMMSLPCLMMSVFGMFYAWRVWHKVPFANANLKLALRAIKDNHGLWILAYFFTFKIYAWVFLWFCAVAELVIFSPSWVYNCSDVDDQNNNACHLSTQGKFIAIGMLLSLCWTNVVVKNIFHTTIAGVVGTWWFDPEEATSASAGGNVGRCGWFSCSCCGCSRAIYQSLYRSTVYSFGSICFGSLLVGILQVLRLIVRCGRRQHDQQRRLRQQRNIEATDLLFCLLQYIVESLEYLMEYINTWAYVYVGLYGYDYWTAGKAVTTLFKARGWSVIINDHLVAQSLSMMSILIGLITGLVGVLLGLIFLSPLQAVPAFFLGAVLGGTSCGILFGVVTSAVNTIVVCFAESPNSLRNNHDPELSDDLIQAWRKAYPQDCGF